jgi:N-acetylmuramoyl-L-alanine amidase
VTPSRGTLAVSLLVVLALLSPVACASVRTDDGPPDTVAPVHDAAPEASVEDGIGTPPPHHGTPGDEVSLKPILPPLRPTPTTGPVPTSAQLEGRVVALDPGHNGGNAANPDAVNRLVDAGGFMKPCNTVGTSTDDGYPESQLNLDIALLVLERLEAQGAKVLLTRESNDGTGPCIDERGRFGGSVGADLLVSIHADGAPPEEHGFHVITPALVPGYTEGIVDPSAALARMLRDALIAAGLTPATYRGVQGIDVRGDLGTLNHSTLPAVIVECANLRNAEEAARLRTPDGRAQIADGIATGIATFLSG